MLDFSHIEKYRENNRIEAKKALGGLPKSLWETYSAFANTIGGMILLGVEEWKDHSLHPVNLPDPDALIAEFWAIANDPKRVSANILSDRNVVVEEIEGNRIIVIMVPRAQRYDRPVFLDRSAFSGSYRRNGEGDYRCSRDEVEAMLREAAIRTQDMAVLESMNLQVFDYDSVHRYRLRMKQHRPGHVWETLDDTAFLHQLGAVGSGADEQLHPTAAGLLLFGRESEIIRKYPNYMLDYQKFVGADTTHWAERIVSSSGDWSGNLYDFYIRIGQKLVQAVALCGAGNSVLDGLQEALVNCLMHADYCSNRGIVIIQKPDCITFSNPGTFHIDLTVARRGGVSEPRNAGLSRMFHLLGDTGRFDGGISGIYRVWARQGWRDPVLSDLREPERTTLTLSLEKSGEDPLSMQPADPRVAVVAYLTDHISACSRDLARALELPLPQVRRILKELAASELVVAEGSGRNRIYKLKA